MTKRNFGKVKLRAAASALAVIVGMMGVTGVAYADSSSVKDDMVSVGVYKYDADSDGNYDEGDIILDARDITNLAEAVDTLNSKYTAAIAELSANKYALVQAMDATVTAKNKILSSGATDADDISFDTIISTISNLQTPSTATASYYAGGTNGDNSTNGYLADSGLAATSSSVSSGTATISLNTSGASDLTVGVNESVTLESGYYSDPVTISNGVVNRGTVSTTLTSSDNTITLSPGYYDSITVSTDITNLPGTITYTHHLHSLTSLSEAENNTSLSLSSVSGGYADSYLASSSGGCFTEPYYSYTYTTSSTCSAGTSDFTVYAAGQRDDEWGNTVYFAYAKCNVCGGRTPDYSCYGSSSEAQRNCRAHVLQGTLAISHAPVTKTLNGEGSASDMPSNVISKSIIGYSLSCGYTNGQVLSATITY